MGMGIARQSHADPHDQGNFTTRLSKKFPNF
jgi:hypothetical protein